MENGSSEKPVRTGALIATIMLFQVSALFIRSFSELRMIDSGVSPQFAKQYGVILGLTVLSILMLPVMKREWPSIKPYFKRPPSWPRIIIASMALAVLLWTINTLILVAISVWSWPSSTDTNQTAFLVRNFSCSNSAILLLSIPATALATPAYEEVINRGIFLRVLLSKGRVFAVLLSSILFAILHAPETYVTAFVFGLAAAILFIKWQTLWGGVVMHCTFNLLVLINEVCVEKFWMTGKIDWAILGFAQVATSTLILSILAALWLLFRFELRTDL